MNKRPPDTSAEEPDGGNPHIRFRGGPRQGDRPGLLNNKSSLPAMNPPEKNLEILRSLVQFAYAQGFHELGYDIVAEIETQMGACLRGPTSRQQAVQTYLPALGVY